jgi:hypothetical protein
MPYPTAVTAAEYGVGPIILRQGGRRDKNSHRLIELAG